MNRRTRRTLTYISVAILVLFLAALAAIPPFRHSLPFGGWPSVFISATGIGGGLSYLRASRS